MARTPVAAAQIVTPNNPETVEAIVADARDFAWTNSDSANGMSVPASGKDLILVRNNGVAAGTVTIDAAADTIGRDGSIAAYSVGVDEIAWFGLFNTSGWRQTDGNLHIDMSDDTIQIVVIRIP